MRSPDVMQRHLRSAHAPSASLLRASVAARLGVVAVAVGVLWLAVLWALS